MQERTSFQSGTSWSRTVPLIVATAYFMETLDGTVVNTALPAMAAGFGTTPLAMSLGITAYLLAVVVVIPAAGWAAEAFGARNVFASAVAAFTLATLLVQLSLALSVALATFALSTSRSLHGGGALQLADFRHAWLVVAALMAVSASAALRLDPSTGAATTGPS